MKSAFLAILMMLPLSALAEDCNVAAQQLMAHYQIHHRVANSNNATELHFWRNHRQVAYQYDDSSLIELWQQLPNKQIRPIRYFPNYRRSIEYQPGEQHGSNNWQDKYQIFSPKFLAQMTAGAKRGAGCLIEQDYQMTADGREFKLTWLPRLQLVKAYRVEHGENLLSWQLMELQQQPGLVEQAFKRWQSYQSTDYADIGDSESDPFLAKMIRQGFIQEQGQQFHYLGENPLAAASH